MNRLTRLCCIQINVLNCSSMNRAVFTLVLLIQYFVLSRPFSELIMFFVFFCFSHSMLQRIGNRWFAIIFVNFSSVLSDKKKRLHYNIEQWTAIFSTLCIKYFIRFICHLDLYKVFFFLFLLLFLFSLSPSIWARRNLFYEIKLCVYVAYLMRWRRRQNIDDNDEWMKRRELKWIKNNNLKMYVIHAFTNTYGRERALGSSQNIVFRTNFRFKLTANHSRTWTNRRDGTRMSDRARLRKLSETKYHYYGELSKGRARSASHSNKYSVRRSLGSVQFALRSKCSLNQRSYFDFDFSKRITHFRLVRFHCRTMRSQSVHSRAHRHTHTRQIVNVFAVHSHTHSCTWK